MASNIPDDGKLCPVCLEAYKKPKILRCGHTFCETCIHEYIMKSKKERTLRNGIECPLCRTLTSVQTDPNRPEIWAQSLCSNLDLDTNLSVDIDDKRFMEDKDTHIDTVYQCVCQPCLDHGEHVKATVFCVDCSKYQCSECANTHTKCELTKHHEITYIDGNEDKADFLNLVERIQSCKKHHKKRAYFCLTHDKLCCLVCLLESHRICKTVDIAKAANDLLLEKISTSMKDLNSKVKSASDFWSTRKTDIQSQAKSLQAEIRERRDRVIQMFDAFERNAMSIIKLENHARIPEYNRNRKSCGKLVASIDETLSLCESAMKYGTTVEKYILSRHLKKKCSDIYSSSAKEFRKLRNTKVMIKLPFEDNTEHLDGKLESPYFYSSPIDIDDIEDFMNSRLRLEKSTEKISRSRYRSIDFLADGRLVGIDQLNNKLVVFDKELNYVFEHDLDVRPFSVKTLSTNDTLLVTTGEAKQLLFFELKADDTLYLVKSIKTEYCCDTIAPVDDQTYFVGLFGCKKPLGLVLLGEEEKDVYIDLPEKEYTAENSKCAFDIKSKKLAISDKNSNTVFIIDIKNNQKIAIRSESIMQPREVVFGPDETLFICSGGTNSIVHATTDGKVLTSRKLKDLHPYAVCISKDKRQLAVANMEIEETQISIFDMV